MQWQSLLPCQLRRQSSSLHASPRTTLRINKQRGRTRRKSDDSIDLDALFVLNRELSNLQFNIRVLEQSLDAVTFI